MSGGKDRKEGNCTRCQGPRCANSRGPQGPGWQALGWGKSLQSHHPAPCHFLSPDFQPKVQSRLVGGSSMCQGSVEVRQGKRWEALCNSPLAKSTVRWEEVCREQQCGKVKSCQVLDASEKTSQGLFCPQEKLSQCHQLQERKAYCKRVFVTCELATAHRGQRAFLDLPSKT